MTLHVHTFRYARTRRKGRSRRFSPSTATLTLLLGCAHSPPLAPGTEADVPHLIRDGERWLAGPFSPRTTRALERGNLLVVLGEPIVETGDRRQLGTVVVTDVLGEKTVTVAEHCRIEHPFETGQSVEVFRLLPTRA